jgi:hypothetical protein
MKNLIVFIVLVLVAVGVVGYWRGWFKVQTEDGKVSLAVDKEKFRLDKDKFMTKAQEETRSIKESLSHLFTKSENLPVDEKNQVQKELTELKKKHERLEEQLRELQQAGQDRFPTLRDDVRKQLDETDRRISELKNKLK